jgi:flagellar motor switch protein FliN/FliY
VSDKTVENLELPELEDSAESKKLVSAPTLDMVRDVQVQLTAVLGETTLTVGELFELAENSVLKLNKLVDEPLELVLDNRVVARGTLVAADDNFGVQISEVIHEK